MNPLLLVLVVMLPLGAPSPDPPEAMYARITQSLNAGQFAEAKEYAQTVLGEYPGYVPAAVADAELCCMENGNPEPYASLLRVLDATLNEHRQYYPPEFWKQIKSELRLCDSVPPLPPGAEVAITRQWSELPLNYITLLLLAPMVAISEDPNSSPIPYKRHVATGNPKPSEIQLETLVESLSKARPAKPEELEQVESLSQLPMEKSLPALLKLLEAFDSLPAQTAAETLSDYGVAARSAILASMTISDSKLYHIYALVRIGMYDAEIQGALSAAGRGRPSVKIYANKSLEYLSAKAGRSVAPAK